MSIKTVGITNILKKDFLDYSVSVISDRALVQVSDGLKPVQRRILWTMFNEKIFELSKSANVVGTVLKLHPHGDTSVYDALVKQTQIKTSPILKQGNFGFPITGDKAAAYRYTEVALNDFGQFLFKYIKDDTTKFILSYDEKNKEPVTIPTTAPLLLTNGTEGIAVGFAAKIPSHNLKEVCDALIYLLNNPKSTVQDIFDNTTFQGPDFTNACTITNKKDLINIYKGKSKKIALSGKWQTTSNSIIITELPFGLTTEKLISNIARADKAGSINYVSKVSDETDKKPRIIITFKRGKLPKEFEYHLAKKIDLISSFSVNSTVLNNRQIINDFNLITALKSHIRNTSKVLKDSAKFHVLKLSKNIEVFEGILLVKADLQKAVNIITNSINKTDCVQKLKGFGLSKLQATSVWEMKVNVLSKSNIKTIKEQLEVFEKEKKSYASILKSNLKLKKRIIKEYEYISKEFGTDRITKIIHKKEEKIKQAVSRIEKVPEKIYVSENGFLAKEKKGIEASDRWIKEFETLKVVAIMNDGFAYCIDIADVDKKPKHIRGLLGKPDIEPLCVSSNNTDLLFVSKDGKLKRSLLESTIIRKPKDVFKGVEPFACFEVVEKNVVLCTADRISHFKVSRFNHKSISAGFGKGMKDACLVCAGLSGEDGFVLQSENNETKRLTKKEVPLKTHVAKGMLIRGVSKTVVWTENIMIDGREIPLTKIKILPRDKKSSRKIKIIKNL